MDKGKLTIFTSYTPGAGKSYSMISKAMSAKNSGKTVVIGFLNSSHRDMKMLLKRNGIQKPLNNKYSIGELIDKTPDIVVLDEMGLAGANMESHKKHVYQDVEYLIDKGIDVYCSANLKRFESANPIFRQITGIKIKTTIPDRFLEMAEKIYFVDRDPESMRRDFESGVLFNEKYMKSKIMNKNFEIETLTAYRNVSFEYRT